jgi:hypothetical protein
MQIKKKNINLGSQQPVDHTYPYIYGLSRYCFDSW